MNYEGAGMLAHYHEAAYDAYMTGIAFANIVKYKEVDIPKEERKKGGNYNRNNNNNNRGGRGGQRRGGAKGPQEESKVSGDN